MRFASLATFGIGQTPLHRASRYCRSGNLYVKLEQENPFGSVKDRTAFFLLRALEKRRAIDRGLTVVESTSGNLGWSLSALLRSTGARLVSVVDRTAAPCKVKRLCQAGATVVVAERGAHPDERSARIALTH